jgi:hypothetical protein
MRRLVLVAALMLGGFGCGSSSSATAPEPTYPTVQGVYTGTYAVSSCSDNGLTGFCETGAFSPGTQFPISLSLGQTQSNITGTMILGGVSGTFQGTLTTSGALSGTAALGNLQLSGLTFTLNVPSWSSVANANTMTGSFQMAFRVAGATGSPTVNAIILQLSR